jgi:hypothetical protein
MRLDWKLIFTKSPLCWADDWCFNGSVMVSTLAELKTYLDLVHIRYCLVKPFCQQLDYPVVETRELLPSFECDLWEYKHLPGFSLVAFERPIDYFSEIFQFDILHPVHHSTRADLAQNIIERNLAVFQSRMPRSLQANVRNLFTRQDVTDLNHYPRLSPFLYTMDRAQVFGLHGDHPQEMRFYLGGVYASFPSDLDSEIKRYGLRVGKFSLDHPEMYEQNRNFVCQHLMELYGFPFSSERRTSAALFARRLHKIGERFLVRTLSQSDRCITTVWSTGENSYYPQVDKVALVAVDEDYEQFHTLRDGGFFIDEERRIVILRVTYRQHKFSQDNVRQERALSVDTLEVIHPLTAETLPASGLIRDSSNMVLRLNDIVRGEHSGRIMYKRIELVEDTKTQEHRLKYLYAWLTKHQRRIIGYSDEFFSGISKVLNNYLYSQQFFDEFEEHKELYAEVTSRYSYILQARTIRLLEDLHAREVHGEKISYAEMLSGTVELLHALKFEIVSYFDSLVLTAISIGESMLNDRYLVRSYINRDEELLTPSGLEIRKNYGRLVSLIDELKAIRKTKN